MATVMSQNEKDKDEKKQIAAGPVEMGKQAGTIGMGAPAAQAGKGTSSGRFTNLQSYLKANQGGQAMAGQIGQKLQGQAKEVEGQTQKAQQQFQQGLQGQQQLMGQSGQIQQQLKEDPTKLLQNDQFGQLRDFRYSGPQGLQNTQQAQAQLQGLGDTTKQLQSEQGRFQALRSMFNQPTYSRGQTRLDQAMMQADPRTLQQLKQTQNIAQQAQRQFGQTAAQAEQQAQQAAMQGEKVREDIRSTLLGESEGLGKTLEQRAAEENKAREQAYSDALKRAQNLGLTQEDMSKLGVSAGQEVYGVDLSKYLGKGAQASAASVMQDPEIKRIQALSQLAGGKVDNAALQNLANAQAQKAAEDFRKTGKVEYADPAQLQAAIQSAKSSYDYQSAPLLAKKAAYEAAAAQQRAIFDEMGLTDVGLYAGGPGNRIEDHLSRDRYSGNALNQLNQRLATMDRGRQLADEARGTGGGDTWTPGRELSPEEQAIVNKWQRWDALSNQLVGVGNATAGSIADWYNNAGAFEQLQKQFNIGKKIGQV